MSSLADNQRSQAEVEARDALMHEQFQRDIRSWDEGTPLEAVLRKLRDKISRKK